MDSRPRGSSGRFVPRIDETEEEEQFMDSEEVMNTEWKDAEPTEVVYGVVHEETPAVPRNIWGNPSEEEITEVRIGTGPRAEQEGTAAAAEADGSKEPESGKTRQGERTRIPGTVPNRESFSWRLPTDETVGNDGPEIPDGTEGELGDPKESSPDTLMGKLKGGQEAYEDVGKVNTLVR